MIYTNEKKKPIRFIASFLILFYSGFLLAQEENVNIVIFGGGEISNALFTEFVSQSTIEDPNLLIIPYASKIKSIEKAGNKFEGIFKNMGISNIRVLDLSDRKKAIEDIAWSEAIWFSGGGQVRLRKALEKANMFEIVRSKILDGYLTGGTSAGASIMSKVMMANNTTDKETGKMRPVISYGLGVWNNVIIDQHFSQRKRLPRLDTAVKVHPDLVGIGIDESTGVVYRGKNEFLVIGQGSVTVLKEVSRSNLKATDKLQKSILKNDDIYRF